MRLGYTSGEASDRTGVSKGTAQRAAARFSDWQTRIPDQRLYCADCLLRIGCGMNLTVRLTGVAKATVKRFRDRKGYGPSSRAQVNLAKKKRDPEREWMERAWASEWSGVHYIGELRHWAQHPEVVRAHAMDAYHADLERNRARAAEKARARHLAMVRGSNEHLKRLLRCRVFNAIRRQSVDRRTVGRKAMATMQLIGCSIAELRAHLERKFAPGMSWANLGAWHIDHRKPCALFDLTDPSQQQACFHWSNLQPLWAIDNLRKHAKAA